MKRGPIPVEEALKLALQIAEALEAAHDKGVVHRDLKPANIKVTPDGNVKVLDFGLAKAYAGDKGEVNMSNSPTLSDMATQQGVILGTAAYMSPEQAKGRTVDKRADVWAFGCVVFEMLTGRSLFSADDVSQTLARVLERQPDFSSLPANLHPKITGMLERCLEKDVRNRYAGICDARVDIRKALEDPRGIRPVTAAGRRARLRTILLWAATAAVLSVVITGTAVWNLKPTPPPEPHPVSRFSTELPENQQFGDPSDRVLAISPDGRQFVYSTSGGLYLRSMDELDARLITGTEGNPSRPFFSPDGKWLGYWSGAEHQLVKIPVSGGAPIPLTDAPSLGSLNWRADNTIVFRQAGTGVMRIPAAGGTPETLVNIEKELSMDLQVLPDGESILYIRQSQPNKVMVQSLKSGKSKELLAGDFARYVPTGHLVYQSGNNIFAIPFDIEKLDVAGDPILLVGGVHVAQWEVSNSGTLIYIPAPAGAAAPFQRTLLWVDRNGKEQPLAFTPDSYSEPRISPDGKRLALTIGTSNNSDLWILDLTRGIRDRLTFNKAQEQNPLWTRDGKQIAYASDREVGHGVYLKSADGIGKDELVSSGRIIVPASWSRDGNAMVMTEYAQMVPLQFDIGVLSMEGDHKYRPLLKEKYAEAQPQISPDGRWMAYMFNEGQPQVCVRPFPEVDKGRWQVSTYGGHSPLWSLDGRELFYRTGDAVMSVAVNTNSSSFSFAPPKTLFRGKYVAEQDLHPWDISPDGKRFLMMKESGSSQAASPGPRKIVVVLNWFEELKQRVPTK